MEAHWLNEGGQEDDWTSVMMSALSLIVWECGGDAKNSLTAEHLGKQSGE